MGNIMAESVSTPGRDIVEEVAVKAISQPGVMGKRRADMNSTKQTARIAGVLYLVNGVTGLLRHHLCPQQTNGTW